MKNKNLTIFIIIIFFFSNCEKESIDFREKYIGTWFYKVKTSEFLMGPDGYNRNDSLEFTGKIIYGSTKNDLKFIYTKDKEITLSINEIGEISNFPSQYCSVFFENTNKVHLYLRWGGLGGSTTHVIDGFKN